MLKETSAKYIVLHGIDIMPQQAVILNNHYRHLICTAKHGLLNTWPTKYTAVYVTFEGQN